MKNKAAKLKSKRKGTETAFGCDLTEHLQNSGRDVPYVLKTCAEFIEKHGIVDGIYRLSGITSNIQKLRQEFSSEACPDLTKEVYLQDIHCVGSLCKLYFRELPNPLLTYELYSKFTDAVSVKEEQEQLQNIRSVIKELPVSHFRTLEYLTKHLAHLATLSHQTNMHARNLALVWAPNLLRSKEVEVPFCNGDIAFLEVRVQQSVVEFILNHTEQIFNLDVQPSKPREGPSMACGEKYATLPASTHSGPMKLMSLEEAQARSLSPNHPAMRERQRENSLPDTSTAAMYHTEIDLSDSRRKFSGKSKKWKSIFSLGRSVIDSKGKLSRNGSVFMRAQNPSEKPVIRPSKSMDSLCSYQAADEDKAPAEGSNGIFVPSLKSRTLGSDIDYNPNKKDPRWDSDTASGGCVNEKRESASSASPLQKTLPEQLKVFKGDDRSGCQPTSPKNRRMLYSGSAGSGSSRPSFPGSLFPLESSPRQQRKALNISEPFAVSVPLRVSAVINANSTPCRAPGKERDRGLGGLFKPSKEAGPLEAHGGESIGTAGLRVPSRSSSGNPTFTDWEKGLTGHSSVPGVREHLLSDSSRASIYCNSSPFPVEHEDQTGERDITDARTVETTKSMTIGKDAEERELIANVEICEPRVTSETKETGKELDTTSTQQEMAKLDKLELIKKVPSSGMHQKAEAKPNMPDEQVKPCFTKMTGNEDTCKLSAQAQRRSSLPTNTVTETDILQDAEPCSEEEPRAESVRKDNTPKCDLPGNQRKSEVHTSLHSDTKEPLITKDICNDDKVSDEPKKLDLAERIKGSLERLSTCLNEQHRTLESGYRDDVDTRGSKLDQVEPWEDLCSAKQWVTSPLHSPKPTPSQAPHSRDLGKPKEDDLPNSKKTEAKAPAVLDDITQAAVTAVCELGNKNAGTDVACFTQITERCESDDLTWMGDKDDSKLEIPQVKISKAFTDPDETTGLQNMGKAKQKRSSPSQRYLQQTSHESGVVVRTRQDIKPKLRPCSLNLDLGHQGVRDRVKHSVAWECEAKRESSSLELELFLSGSKAPVRRNSAPVSVSSVRTAFMIKTCKAKAIPVIPPKIQYSHIPHTLPEGSTDQVNQTAPEKRPAKSKLGKAGSAPPVQRVKDHREDLSRSEPPSVLQRQIPMNENHKPTSVPDLPVLRRKRSANGDTFMDRPRPERSSLLQRSSFRNRPRPQSLILFSPPFPIMDYPPLGDDGKLLLSPIKAEASPFDVYANELAENLKTAEGVTLRDKMTLPKSGQRLETSTSCFYQPQRRSMIFENRSNRQIE
ncbi:rho GTPase-activating protein 31-like isoform X3 [Carassius gibelio]|uniref:rho GTPase-activating protein 31-like isoform X3 n=1 Tax=Carassius gibelio TaxID=101364 RepID=UPI002277CE93|nr:rho GTPase-activating protein 31-like isoform X3 [Carassius gibelio]